MSKSRTPSGSERKEPQLSPMTNLERMPDEPTKPSLGEYSYKSSTASAHQRAGRSSQSSSSSTSKNTRRNTSQTSQVGLWCAVLLLIMALVSVSGFGYIELERVNGLQRATLEQVNRLATASDQFDTKLSASGGQLQQTQSSVNARVTQLETKVSEQLQLVEQIAQQAKTSASNLKAQLAADLEKQAAVLQSTTTTLKSTAQAIQASVITELNSTLDKRIAASNALQQTHTQSIKEFKQSLAVLDKGMSQVSLDLKRETTGFNQSLQLLKEELAIDPARLKTLQDQFTTYMQSVDQFRQQTNASLNELSTQVRDVYRAQESLKSTTQTSGFDEAPPSFGVQPAPR